MVVVVVKMMTAEQWYTMLHKVLARTSRGGWDTGPPKTFI